MTYEYVQYYEVPRKKKLLPLGKGLIFGKLE